MSTSTERFTTNCPSCDAGVAVKAALVGKKIECPKCKFRFVVPAPAGGEPAAPAKADKPGKSKSAATALADGSKGDPKGGKEKKEGKGKSKGGKAKAGKAGKAQSGGIASAKGKSFSSGSETLVSKPIPKAADKCGCKGDFTCILRCTAKGS